MRGRRRRRESDHGEENEALSESPFPGDLDKELAKAPRSRRLPGLTTYLAAAVLLAAGFAIGTQVDRHLGQHGSGSPQGAAAMPGAGGPGGGMRGGMPGGGGMPGQAGGGPGRNGGGAGATTGTVQKVDGNTIYVTTANGGTVQVKVTGATKVGVLQNGSVKDLKSGVSVTVQGDQAKDGTLTATSVSQGGSSGG